MEVICLDFREVGRFLAKAALIDSRHVTELHVLEWHDHIGHLPLDVAVKALNTHRAESTDYLQPAHILKIVSRGKSLPPHKNPEDPISGHEEAPAGVNIAEWILCRERGAHSFKGGWCVFCFEEGGNPYAK